MKNIIATLLFLFSVSAFAQDGSQPVCPIISEDIHPDPSLHLTTEHLNQLRIQQFVKAHACGWIKSNDTAAIKSYIFKPLYWDFTREATDHPAFLNKSAIEQYQQLLKNEPPYLVPLPPAFAMQMLLLVRSAYEDKHELHIDHGIYEQAITPEQQPLSYQPGLPRVPGLVMPSYALPYEWFD